MSPSVALILKSLYILNKNVTKSRKSDRLEQSINLLLTFFQGILRYEIELNANFLPKGAKLWTKPRKL